MIKGIIFDFDGLICDTETPELNAWNKLFLDHDREFPIKEYLASIGVGYNDSNHALFLEKIQNYFNNAEKVINDFFSLKKKLMDQEPLRPGVIDYLQAADKSDFVIGLASSSPSEWVVHHLNRLGVINFFDCIRTADDVKNPKPDPEVYLNVLNCMNIYPQEAIALEDSPNGVKAASEAGVHVIAVPNSVTKVFNFDEADLLIDSLANIPLRKLISKISKPDL